MSDRYFSNRPDLTYVKTLDRKGYPPGHPSYLKEACYKVKFQERDSDLFLIGWLSRDNKRFMEGGRGVVRSDVQEFLDNPDLGIEIHSAVEISEKQYSEMVKA